MKLDDSPFTKTLPPKETPHQPDGSFDWLRQTPTHDELAIGDEKASDLPTQLNTVIGSANQYGIGLPNVFLDFVSDPTLHKNLRSANGDYLDLAESLLPVFDGYLVRFLSDQQGCAFWYLFLSLDGSDHCVVSSYEYFDADDMDYEPDELSPDDFTYFSPTFEDFFCRYWIEHEMMFHRSEETPPPNVDLRFLQLYGGEQ
ncbi:hypothetical protein SH528x_003172 [Novipirellula sp. SH528]|uniref:hypothetical protein n=1 Tax=Novipirellula sp. SH528 TaxID=3454466 RepID=UPI003FA16418